MVDCRHHVGSTPNDNGENDRADRGQTKVCEEEPATVASGRTITSQVPL